MRLEIPHASEAATSSNRPKSPWLALISAPWLKAVAVSMSLAAVGLFYFAVFHPDRFGSYRDDGLYVVMAKALANGQGYHLISLPQEPVQTKAPPFLPLLLSLIWRAYPHFPENLTWMALLPIMATLIFLAASWQYLVARHYSEKWMAWLVVTLTALNWRVIVLATGIYSEMVYAALSLVALYLAERVEREERSWAVASLLGIITGLAFLTRSSGIALVFAMGFYFVARRQWKKGLLPLGVAALLVIGWLAWGYIKNSAIESVNAGSYESYFQTFNGLLNHSQAQSGASKVVIFLSIIGKNALGLILVSVPVVCLGLGYEWIQYFGFSFIFIAAGFVRQVRRGWRLLHIYVACYLAVHLLWPYSSYDRFLIPVLPFLLFCLVSEVGTMVALVGKELRSGVTLGRRVSAGFIGVALCVAVGIIVTNYGSEIYSRLSSASLKKVAGPAPDDRETTEWIEANTGPTDVLVCYRDPLYYLYTGRKAVRSSLSRAGDLMQTYQSTADDRAQAVVRIVEENGARYLIVTPSDFDLEYQPEAQREGLRNLLEAYPQQFVPVFKSGDGGSTIYRIIHSEQSNRL